MKIAWTTTETREQAIQLARISIESKLAACAQVSGPISSIYNWKGKCEETTEFRITFKFPDSHLPALREAVLRNHCYETPQWIVVDASDVSEAYKSWVEIETS